MPNSQYSMSIFIEDKHSSFDVYGILISYGSYFKGEYASNFF